MTTIRLLHVSDLHISKFLNIRQFTKGDRSAVRDGLTHFTVAPAHSPGTLTRFLSFVRQKRKLLDGIIITGDIATTGRAFDLKKALSVVQHRLNPIGINVALLPGNHDRWTPHRRGHDSAIMSFGYDPGGTVFHSIFSSYWGPGDVCSFTFAKDNLKVVAIAADLSLRTAQDAEIWRFINKHGQGKVYDDILNGLEKATLNALDNSEGTTAVLWAIHFPPLCENIASDMKLIGERMLLDKADELGVPIVLAGHSHVPSSYRALPFQTDVFCAGTLTEYNHTPNQFFMISVEDMGGDYRVQLDNYQYDRLKRSFIRT